MAKDKDNQIRLHLPSGDACLFCGVAMPDGDSPVWFERCAVRENVATASLSDVCKHKEIESLFGQQTAAAYLLTGQLR